MFQANTSGGFNAPTTQWDSGPDNWDLLLTRLVVGDFNGDGRDDIGGLYGYAYRQTRLWVFQANASGGLNAPVVRWDSGLWHWDLAYTRVVAGDVNRDGQADIGAFQGYPNSQTKLWVFQSKPWTSAGEFEPPVVRWDSGPNTWDLTRTRLVAGDFNVDGRTDIGAFYGYVNRQTRLFVFETNYSGVPTAPTVRWDSGPDSWDLSLSAPI